MSDNTRPGSTIQPDETDGRHDFDFIFGTWKVHNHKLRDAADRDCTDWIEFETRSHAEPILGGLAHIDRIVCGPGSPHGDWEGFTLRQFDPGRQLWQIWWASTKAPGRLDPPLLGRFETGIGRFAGDDVLDGRPIKVRFEWTSPRNDRARWSQAFSWDDGRNWRLNWIMEFTPDDAGVAE